MNIDDRIRPIEEDAPEEVKEELDAYRSDRALARLIVIEWILENGVRLPRHLPEKFRQDQDMQAIRAASPLIGELAIAYLDRIVETNRRNTGPG